jgi:hypothetical protein
MIGLALVEQRTQLLTRAWVRAELAEKRQDERVSYSPISAGRFHQDSDQVGRAPVSRRLLRRAGSARHLGHRVATGSNSWREDVLGPWESNSSGPRARSVERRRCRLPASSPVLAPGPFRFGPGASRGRSSGRPLLASPRRSCHGNPRYRSAGIVTLEPLRLVAPWIGHTYSGASPDRWCAWASRRIGTESNRRGLGRSRGRG